MSKDGLLSVTMLFFLFCIYILSGSVQDTRLNKILRLKSLKEPHEETDHLGDVIKTPQKADGGGTLWQL